MICYLSKWSGKWIEFESNQTKGELLSLKKYHYKVMLNDIEVSIDSLINQIDGNDTNVVTIS